MTPAPKRRWFRFSLRTLFVVVTAVGGWLGYELHWIRQREQFVAQQWNQVLLKQPDRGEFDFGWWEGEPGTSIRGLLGYRQYYLVYVFVEDGSKLSTDDIQRIDRATALFPEAKIGTICYRGNRVFNYREGKAMFDRPGGGMF